MIAVPLFIFMGVMLEKSGVAVALLENMSKIWGEIRGGLVYSVLIVGVLMAASTGLVEEALFRGQCKFLFSTMIFSAVLLPDDYHSLILFSRL